MPKKTTYSRSSSSAPRGKAKQKTFELVRPLADETELESVRANEKSSVSSKTALKVEEEEEKASNKEEQAAEEDEDAGEEVEVKKPELVARAARTGKKNVPASSVSIVDVLPGEETSSASSAPKS